MLSPNIIYIIDDDPDDQYLLIEAIKEIDLTIERYTAMNGQEGLNRLEANTVPFPSIIFLDLNMPRIDGRKFLTLIKKSLRFKTVPVVIYTTSVSLKEKEEMLQLGAMDYLVKQDDFDLLKKSLHTIFIGVM